MINEKKKPAPNRPLFPGCSPIFPIVPFFSKLTTFVEWYKTTAFGQFLAKWFESLISQKRQKCWSWLTLHPLTLHLLPWGNFLRLAQFCLKWSESSLRQFWQKWNLCFSVHCGTRHFNATSANFGQFLDEWSESWFLHCLQKCFSCSTWHPLTLHFMANGLWSISQGKVGAVWGWLLGHWEEKWVEFSDWQFLQ